jgi:DNA-directed RNA polymerase sigma subunit (sigma70/sigma32)
MKHSREPFNNNDMRQSEIAAELGVGCERVRQIEVKALQDLRQKLKERGIVSLDQVV